MCVGKSQEWDEARKEYVESSNWTRFTPTCIMILGTIQPLGLILDERTSEIHRADGEEIGFSGQSFLLNKVSKNASTSELELQRPEITWTPTTGGGLMITRAHGCMAHDTTNELVYLMGGRTDPDPQQSNDESSTNLSKYGTNHQKLGPLRSLVCQMHNNTMNVYKSVTKSTQLEIGILAFPSTKINRTGSDLRHQHVLMAEYDVHVPATKGSWKFRNGIHWTEDLHRRRCTRFKRK